MIGGTPCHTHSHTHTHARARANGTDIFNPYLMDI